MIVTSWTFSYSNSASFRVRHLADDIARSLPRGEWDEPYKKTYKKRLNQEINKIVDWDDVISDVRHELFQHITFKPTYIKN